MLRMGREYAIRFLKTANWWGQFLRMRKSWLKIKPAQEFANKLLSISRNVKDATLTR